MTMLLSTAQIVSLIKSPLAKQRTIIIEGENGIGKTGIYHAVKSDPYFANHIHIDPIDCTQLSDGSVWMPDLDKELGVSRELPNERFGVSKTNQKGVNGSRPVLIFLDEIAKARQYIKDVLAPIAYEHRVGNYHFAEGSVVFCATNLSTEGLGDSIQAHLRNRLIFVRMRKPTQPEWRTWALNKGLSAEVIAFTDEYTTVFDSFLDYEDGGKYADKQMHKHNPMIFNPRESQLAYASPRSLHGASDVVASADLYDKDTLLAALEGTIGEVAASKLATFIEFGTENPSFRDVVANPDTAKIAKSPVAQIVMSLKVISQTNTREEAEAVVKYMRRMRNEIQSMFCNSLANSDRIGTFITIKDFGAMLAENKILFATK